MQQPGKPWIATSEVVYDPLGTTLQVLSATGDSIYLQAWVGGCRVVLLMRREHTVMRIDNLSLHSDGSYTVSRAHEGQRPRIPPCTVRNAEGEVQRHPADHWVASTNVAHNLTRGTELDVIEVSGAIYYMELALGCPIILLMRLEYTLISTDDLSTVVAACRPLVTAAAMPSEATQQEQKQQLQQWVKQKQKQLLQRCISNATRSRSRSSSSSCSNAVAMMPPST